MEQRRVPLGIVPLAPVSRLSRPQPPATQGGDGLIAFERVTAEQNASRALDSLARIGVYHPDFDAQFRDFADAVLAHAAHEEELEFLRIRWEFTDEQLHLMASEVLTVQSMA